MTLWLVDNENSSPLRHRDVFDLRVLHPMLSVIPHLDDLVDLESLVTIIMSELDMELVTQELRGIASDAAGEDDGLYDIYYASLSRGYRIILDHLSIVSAKTYDRIAMIRPYVYQCDCHG